jgi:arginine exporter protein ArgO
MKQLMSILVVAAAGIIALVEQSKAQPNPIIMIGAIGIFMYGMYKLMKKIPSKNEDNDDTEI